MPQDHSSPPSPAGDILWLGVHKTGTTYLQSLLPRARPALARAGLLHVGLAAFRSLYTDPVLNGGAGTPTPLPRDDAKAPRYLIFDENIPALVQDVLSRHALYPDGAERALQLARRAGIHPNRIVLGIRSFDSYLPSLYCEVLKSMPFLPFADFNRIPLTALSWSNLIERLAAAFPLAQICVYRAEDLKGREADLLAWVTGLASQDFPAAPGPVREGFSQGAIDALHELHRQGPVSRQDVVRCLEAHPRTPGSAAFRPWEDARQRDLKLAYALDLEEIGALEKSTQDRVTLWRPKGAAS
ncbi:MULTISPECIES: hypothetical protein [Phaeobacter]|jgi:hypothetical protein|uniref:hypothetical protein n=1 Tax=Phaeobacter TaxID=302485 RepID=UPI000D5E823C|nr:MULTISPECIES: hypothetical protein [Phaeobacter]MEE2635243.1 hypothetical protein [Pseudomonadota bacterium]MDE4099375.1 hypothetical protein [Phaeobacter gallaeciensis]MDE4108214.1 hypothetical protein [Phaeobacter gallaeciensis]MDE4112634.1 hypothetical protein [Phaeobacter gallaeciensis]MDE4117121.1 hypothetical protein [Phaeobacter gallaeciensis]